MTDNQKRVELTEAERGQLFAAGDHHPDMCDCTDRAAEVGYAPDSEEVCEALVNTFVVVERIIASREAAARREALLEAADAWAAQKVPWDAEVHGEMPPRDGPISRWLRDRAALAEPERDEEGGND